MKTMVPESTDASTPPANGGSSTGKPTEPQRIKGATRSFLVEFQNFAMKGNAVDMAVGIIIGAAFNKVVQSIVNDLLMPPLGFVISGVPFRELRIILKEATATSSEVAIAYGVFINTLIEFLIIALTVFVVVKVMNRLMSGLNRSA